jgi:hypothetical protein
MSNDQVPLPPAVSCPGPHAAPVDRSPTQSSMDDVELQTIGSLLWDCQEALHECDGSETMTIYLHRLHTAVERLRVAEAQEPTWKPLLVLLQQQAHTLQQQIEDRLGVRNWT